MDQQHSRTERGAILVQTVIMMVGLTAFSTFVIDYGILWSARRQAQNSADAAALAAASYLAFTDIDDYAGARTAALDAAARNMVWGASPDVTAADVTVPIACPPNAPSFATATCVKVDVFRNQRAGGSPLPSIFGTLVGITDQGVRATATAEIIYGNATNCVKPFAIPDKWLENQTPVWDVDDSFSRYSDSNGTLVPNPDVYVPPVGTDNGSGFDVTADYGLELVIKDGHPHNAIQPGWFSPVIIVPGDTGGDDYRERIATCAPTVIGPGTVLTMEPGDMVGPTQQGVQALIDLDEYADWDPNANNGRGGITGGCMADASPCTLSPRVVAIPVFDPDTWDLGPSNGRSTVVVTRIIGMFIDRMQGNDVVGYLMPYPSSVYDGVGGEPGAAFVVNVILVR